ncbi:MAG: Ig-like domain-containing protein [Bacteroidales bacterium]|nr:Ig-like domain-containing protein [Bacteroidales bacterium]
MKPRQITFMAGLCVALLGFIGCRPEAVPVDSITLRPTEKELMVGTTYQIVASVLPADAPHEVEWSSSNATVATVSEAGVVTAVAVGECDITATAGDKSAVCHITVVDGTPSDPDVPVTGPFDNNGASTAVFSVEEGRTVHFSRGNLQYQASTEMWRFAEHQYDYMGSANRNISSDNTGWIDLFGWGTSGWNSGANAYQPWATSSTNSDYYPGGSLTNNLEGDYANGDWGVYNAISNGGGRPGMWRTLTNSELNYLLYSRAASSVGGHDNVRYAKAKVNNVLGLIIFPDVYSHPDGVAEPDNANTASATFNSYVLTASDWEQMETAGCIFLPAAGYRNGTSTDYVGSYGGYWTSTYYNEDGACNLFFMADAMELSFNIRSFGLSVRLVKD